jgi:hypothetical protein
VLTLLDFACISTGLSLKSVFCYARRNRTGDHVMGKFRFCAILNHGKSLNSEDVCRVADSTKKR